MPSGSSFDTKEMNIYTIATRKIAVTPHYFGTVFRPSDISQVPTSTETVHNYLVGMTENDFTLRALDLSAAQFGLSQHFPFADEVKQYQCKLGTHRVLEDFGQRVISYYDPISVDTKRDACTPWAINALKSIWTD